MQDALPAATLPIYTGLGQAQEYAGLALTIHYGKHNDLLKSDMNTSTV